LTRPVTYARRRSHLLSSIPSVHNTLHHQCFGFLSMRAVRKKALDGTYLLPEYSNGGRQGHGICLDRSQVSAKRCFPVVFAQFELILRLSIIFVRS
jgi:hypothetical protein